MEAAHPSPELSLVIPARNEAAGLRHALGRLSEVLAPLGVTYELWVIDDGSLDGTFDLIRQASLVDSRIKGVRLSRGFGKEAALLAGLRAASGRAVITLDADLQHPPEVIPEMLAAWRAGAQVVHGIKRGRGDRGVRGGAARSFNRLFSRLAGFDLSGASDFILLDREVVDAIAFGFDERARFFRGMARWVGYAQVEVGFDVPPRVEGASQWSRWALVRYALRNLAAFSSLPLQLVPALGGVMLLVALLLGGEALVSRLSGEAISGFATLEITLLFVGSVIMIGLGIIGQYLALLYDELKRRPHYLIAESTSSTPDLPPRHSAP